MKRSFALVVALTAACGGAYHYPDDWFARPSRVDVLSDSVVIAAEDGSFTWNARNPAEAPKQCVAHSNDDYAALFPLENKGNFLVENWKCTPLSAQSYPVALRLGATRVLVRYPGFDKPLHGVLMLNCGPQPQREIEIPKQYVDATSGGRVSVVFEQYNATGDHSCLTKWALWLSREEFK